MTVETAQATDAAVIAVADRRRRRAVRRIATRDARGAETVGSRARARAAPVGSTRVRRLAEITVANESRRAGLRRAACEEDDEQDSK